MRAAVEVFREHGDFLRAVVRFQVRNKSDEEDLFQEFFLALIRKPVPADVRNIRSYLYHAVVHHVVDAMRTRENYRRSLKNYAKEIRISINNRPPRNALVDDEEEKEAVVAYFARHLQDREAQAFVLRYRDNCSNAEIAARMGIREQTVRRYLSVGMKKLRNTLAAE